MKTVNINNYECKYLISYSIQHMEYKDKIRFYYALKGRDGKSGIVEMYKATVIARSIFLIDEKNYKEFVEFLEYWKCSLVAKRVFVRR